MKQQDLLKAVTMTWLSDFMNMTSRQRGVEESVLLFKNNVVLLASSDRDLWYELECFAAKCEVARMSAHPSLRPCFSAGKQIVLSRFGVSCCTKRRSKEGKMIFELDGLIGVAKYGWCRTMLNRELSWGKAFSLPLDPYYTFGHVFWVVTERTRSHAIHPN